MESKRQSIQVFGGGPAGLTFSIRFVDFCRLKGIEPRVQVLDIRWKKAQGVVSFAGNRRGQVVTLQNQVLEYLGNDLRKTLTHECKAVWGPSINTPIELAEDRLLKIAQSSTYSKYIELIPTNEVELKKKHYTPLEMAHYGAIVCADGSRSMFMHTVLPTKTRQTASVQPDSALGVEFSGQDYRSQDECVILTLCNRRYLLNADPIRGRGFLNVALGADEAEQVKTYHGESFSTWHAQRNNRGAVFAQVVASIEAGFKLFGIKPTNANKVNFIELDLSHSPNFCFEIPSAKMQAWIIGDAAFSTHFWPGRGMNSALKEAVQLAWILSEENCDPNVFRGFMMNLREREHTERSQLFLCRRGMGAALRQVAASPPTRKDAIANLIIKASSMYKSLARRSGWSLKTISECDLLAIFSSLPDRELQIMDRSGSWPPAPGTEVLPAQEILSANVDEEKVSKPPCTWVGIDLGTSTSSVAVMTPHGIHIISNPQGNRCTPSVVAYTENAAVLVGEAAKWQSASNPANTVFEVKRVLGRRPDDPVVIAEQQRPTRSLVIDEGNKTAIQLKLEHCRKPRLVSPEEVTAEILRSMKATAETYLQAPVQEAVITVPAYFSDAQRQATLIAAKLAGLLVKRIINEPTAAALAYMTSSKLVQKVGQTTVRWILAYDFGGGTFDVSVMQMQGELHTVIATGGDSHLGGADLDDRIVNHLCEIFKTKHPKSVLDQRALERLRQGSEYAKKRLTSTSSVMINIPNLVDGFDVSELLTKAIFESKCSDLFEKTMSLVKEVLEEAAKKVSHEIKLDDVLMIGGSSRIPKVKQLLQQAFKGVRIHSSLNPDEVVAYGAAMHAANLAGYSGSHVVIVDVTPLSLGIDVAGDMTAVIIPRNTPIPCKLSKKFTNYIDNQTYAHIEIFQGERVMSKDNLQIGVLNLTLPPSRKGTAKVEAIFQVDTNGILQVTTIDQIGGHVASAAIVACGQLSAQRIDALVNEAKRHSDEDKLRKLQLDVVHEIEMQIYWITCYLLDPCVIRDLTAAQRTKASAINETAKKWLDDAKLSASLEVLQHKLEELSKFAHSLFSLALRQETQRKCSYQGELKLSPDLAPKDWFLAVVHSLNEYLLPLLASSLQECCAEIQQKFAVAVAVYVRGLSIQATALDDLSSFVINYLNSVEVLPLKQDDTYALRYSYVANACVVFENVCMSLQPNLAAAATCHLNLALLLFNRATSVSTTKPRAYAEILPLLEAAEQALSLARSRATEDEDFQFELEDCTRRVRNMMSTVQSAQCCAYGHQGLASSVHDYEDFAIGLFYISIDHFARAASLADNDTEAQAIAFHGMGYGFSKIHRIESRATRYFSQVLELVDSLAGLKDCSKFEWYLEAKSYLDRPPIVSLEGQASARGQAHKAHIEKIELLKNTPTALLVHLYAAHPPKRTKSSQNMSSNMDRLSRAIADYHPDQNSADVYGSDWHAFCEDVLAILNAIDKQNEVENTNDGLEPRPQDSSSTSSASLPADAVPNESSVPTAASPPKNDVQNKLPPTSMKSEPAHPVPVEPSCASTSPRPLPYEPSPSKSSPAPSRKPPNKQVSDVEFDEPLSGPPCFHVKPSALEKELHNATSNPANAGAKSPPLSVSVPEKASGKSKKAGAKKMFFWGYT